MRVTLLYAEGDAPRQEEMLLPEGCTLEQALSLSRLAAEVNPFNEKKVGIFGQLCLPDQILQDGDRIEIYRPLLVDPKEARRRRAEVRRRKECKPGG